ncbi:SigB/SigF/SigG family RNA polymerase sigma factor [Angustibacter luteus]|uniref:SigB/SigF/SigG family RNA polymerase sigma factor n=1 Tax=Angustibacter luteus TaxID=658456 RepID=A0ABW1JJH9_9ACTN
MTVVGARAATPGSNTDVAQELAALPAQDPRRAELRTQLVEENLPLVRYLAQRYRDLGEPLDDLIQVGTIGLINAVDRFDPDRGAALTTFATPTILGEIKRHFRDRGWALRVPRRLQELQTQLEGARAELNQALGRAPTVHELAEQVGISTEEAIEALEAQQAYSTVPLEGPIDGLDADIALVDTALEDVVDRESLRPLLHRLPAREKRILVLRFFRGLSQNEIADELGISQMHVSRLLSRTVDDLRKGLEDLG